MSSSHETALNRFVYEYRSARDIPAEYGLAKNYGREFSQSRRSKSDWDSVTFQEDGFILLKAKGTNEEFKLPADTVIMVEGLRRVSPTKSGKGWRLDSYWNYVEIVCNDGSHLVSVQPENGECIFWLALQGAPFAVGLDIGHRIYLSDVMKEDQNSSQRERVLELANQRLRVRLNSTKVRAARWFFLAGISCAVMIAAVIAKWPLHGVFITGVEIAAFVGVGMMMLWLFDGAEIEKRRQSST